MELPHKAMVLALWVNVAILAGLSGVEAEADARKPVYVGSDICRGCHEAQYAQFMASSKKANSFGSIQMMQKKLTPTEFQECYACHTTGYGKPGGFTSVEATPQLRNAGCEVCHGPGSLHAESGDPADLAYKVTLELCDTCHQSERVAAFGFKPILFAGAH